MNCPNCGKEVPNEDAVFCPYCSKPLKLTRKHSSYPTAAGILTIIASCPALLFGIYLLLFSFWIENLILGIFYILAFAFGLTGGILTLKRHRFPLSIIGITIVLVSGFYLVATFVMRYYNVLALMFGLPILILSILSVIFAAISKSEFT